MFRTIVMPRILETCIEIITLVYKSAQTLQFVLDNPKDQLEHSKRTGICKNVKILLERTCDKPKDALRPVTKKILFTWDMEKVKNLVYVIIFPNVNIRKFRTK